jgi:hypothetical protein
MKDINKAIEWGNYYINKGSWRQDYHPEEALTLVQIAEKEIPKSPHIHTENEFDDADGNRGIKVTYVECPNCGTEIDELNGLPRCIECGQVISWE